MLSRLHRIAKKDLEMLAQEIILYKNYQVLPATSQT